MTGTVQLKHNHKPLWLAQLVKHHPVHGKVAGLILVRIHAQLTGRGACGRQLVNVFLLLPLPFFLSKSTETLKKPKPTNLKQVYTEWAVGWAEVSAASSHVTETGSDRCTVAPPSFPLMKWRPCKACLWDQSHILQRHSPLSLVPPTYFMTLGIASRRASSTGLSVTSTVANFPPSQVLSS